VILEPGSPAAIVCHDAGAANIILAWLQAEPPREWRVVMQGPAGRTWSGLVIPGSTTHGSAEQALSGARLLLSGTGWQSDVEYESRRLARERGVRSIAVIDHWVNYRERFVRREELVLPDEIYVTDDYAVHLAEDCFPGIAVRRKPNLYLEAILRQISRRIPERADVLYVLEPVRDDWGRGVQGEFQALDYFASNMGALGIPRDTRIRLRPHPSDTPGKYDAWLERNRGSNAVLDESPTLASAIEAAAWIVGCQSYAMVIALAAGRKVASSLPPWAGRCRLPHAEIAQLRDACG
jgi:hypothetical protein